MKASCTAATWLIPELRIPIDHRKLNAKGCRGVVCAMFERCIEDYKELKQAGVVKDFKLIRSLTEDNCEFVMVDGERRISSFKKNKRKILGFYQSDAQVIELLTFFERMSEWIDYSGLALDAETIKRRINL